MHAAAQYSDVNDAIQDSFTFNFVASLYVRVVKMVRVHFCFVGPPCHDPDGPLDGTKTCLFYGAVKFCQVRCPSGSEMYKAQALYWQCNGGVWQPTETIPDCVGKTRAQFSLLITYISFKVSSGGLVLHQRDIYHGRTSTNGHLSTARTFLVPADDPYTIEWRLFLSCARLAFLQRKNAKCSYEDTINHRTCIQTIETVVKLKHEKIKA